MPTAAVGRRRWSHTRRRLRRERAALRQEPLQRKCLVVDTEFVLHYFRVMKNVTVTLPEDTALWVRVRAAEGGRSVSRWLADLLVGMQRGEGTYDAAMERFFARQPRKLTWSDGRRPTRDELHDRADLR